MSRTVLYSFENFDHDRCVDVFRREDGSFGFESFRRDPEGGGRWFAIGNFGEETFEDREAAVLSARRRVSWFDELT